MGRVKTLFKVAAAALALSAVGAAGWLGFSAHRNFAAAAPEALAALQPSEDLEIRDDEWLVMQPSGASRKTGVILYPGGDCDVRGYAQIQRRLALAGYLVVAVPMPLNNALLAPNRADQVRAAYPDVDRWALIGHSLGGVMAARYATLRRRNLAGLILWDSYPMERNSLADVKFPVVHIHRANAQGFAPEQYAAQRHLFPASSRWIGVPGGAHMYFGAFVGGRFVEQPAPTIGRQKQHDIVVAETLAALADM